MGARPGPIHSGSLIGQLARTIEIFSFKNCHVNALVSTISHHDKTQFHCFVQPTAAFWTLFLKKKKKHPRL